MATGSGIGTLRRPSRLRHAVSHALRERPAVRRMIWRGTALLRRFDRAPNGIYVLCYHVIRPHQLAGLDRQLTYLGRHARFVDADTALELIASGEASRERHVVITIDDGYRDSALAMLPVLKAHEICAIAFVIAGRLAGGRMPDAMETPEGRGQSYLSADDLRGWCEAGMQVGSHTQSHRRLAELSDADVILEMESSREALADATGRPVDHFACPWGQPVFDYHPRRERALALATGYRSMFTTVRGVAVPGTDPFAVPRYVVEPDWEPFVLDAVLA